ncbi:MULTISPECIES: oxygen-independent coproporphyrinogen III oxidase [unclassified Agarivorans]|uniref:oxygen-independent coproporphyrinogen III oxidase n=1 Tax=unclassified Agarivorans TaxID=2636026 RepID=UPI0026E22C62|nr:MULTISPECIES: oxygen-independent coproporphyrinogen III oxidase [unclassified Agarivorans]MDO6685637.1 oxygen-independent coproporphyrinogen III oxidase [Agarivorans sp. 3_MG-2023]MDO6716248.1 oxygen-independent coproporphyrinogen III oxidase [Agarivorans sp. 2_MG-2023]
MSVSTVDWDQQLIEKYNYSGPRYTSYPTALEFNEEFGQAQFTVASEKFPERDLSLYVHIPFCHKLCYYCGCNKVITRHQHKADIYLDYLEQEIALQAPRFKQRKVSQMHWGGGTPTYLEPEQLKRLTSQLFSQFSFAEGAEISIEVDPREIELSTIDLLAKLGFNRLSLGVQDFNKQVQQAVNRDQDEDFIFALVERAKAVGFNSVNIDLIYGLPHQTRDSFKQTLARVIDLDPDRLSVFNYAHLPSRFAAQRKIDEAAMPSSDERLGILRDSIEFLTTHGYQFIGMDHFAKPDDELAIAQNKGELHRNFQGYTTQGEADLLGLGVSSISMLGDAYSQNQKELKTYYAQIDQQGHAQWKGIALNQDDLIRRELIKTLICNFQLSFSDIEQQFNLDFHAYFAEDLVLLKPFVEDGLVSMSNEEIIVTNKGRLLIRNICMCFDVYFRSQARRQQFSRVI